MDSFVSSDGVRIAYRVRGRGRPIIFIHGWASESSRFDRIIEGLEGYKAISYDLRGFGRTQGPDWGLGLSSLARDLFELMEHLELEKVDLFGWSLGALVILEYMANFPQARLGQIYLLDMTPKPLKARGWKLGLDQGNYDLGQALLDLGQIYENFWDFASVFIDRIDPFISKEDRLASQEYMAGHKLLSLAAFYQAFILADYRELLEGEIQLDFNIIYGQFSNFCSRDTAKYYQSKLSRVRLYEIEGASHFLVIERPDKLIEILLDRLKCE